MKISRRDFLQDSFLTTAGAYIIINDPLASDLVPTTYKGTYRGALAIMQGLATQSTSQFVVLTPSDTQYGYTVTDSKGKSYRVRITNRETRSYSSWGIEKLLVGNLKPNTDYTLKIIDQASGQSVDERFFKSLDTKKLNPRIMIASCMKDQKEDKREMMWDHVAECAPDVVFLIGDTCYADNNNDGSDAGYWNRYVETRSLLSHFRQKNLIPTLAVWDDHDFAFNNADGSFAKKEMTKQLFKLFWDNEPQENAIIKGPGVSQIFSAFGQRYFMMDSRFFRSPMGTQNMQMWGRQQEDFLFENFNDSSSPVWLMNGSQFFGGYNKKDAFEYNFNDNLKMVCKELSKMKAPTVFVSGDVHFSEYMNIEADLLGYKTYEITSSSIHSTTIAFNHLRHKNPRRIEANSAHQFAIIESSVDPKNGWTINSKNIKAGMKETMKQSFIVKR